MRDGTPFRHLIAIVAACSAITVACARSSADKSDDVPPREQREVRALDELPNHIGSVKFAVIGDSGRGDNAQYDIAAQMVAARERFKFSFVIMNGDNIYEGPASPEDYREKFEKPYQTLLDAGVKFYAVLGNHDDPRQIYYQHFNMGGNRYYTFRPPEDPVTRFLASVRFFAVDTVTLDRPQLRWLEEQLRISDSRWKIVFFHHPMYTSGRYQHASAAFRILFEPLFVKYGVDVVFSGHEHFYMRSELQNGIQYFVSGGAGSLRYGDSGRVPFVAKAFDTDYHFMLVEIERDVMSVEAISRKGAVVDRMALTRRTLTSSADTARPQPPAAPVP